MNKHKPTWQQFEDLVQRILEANNFNIKINSQRGDTGFDFIGFLGDEEWAIEVKHYRTARARPSLIESAAARVINNGLMIDNIQKGMLIISSILTKELRHTLEEKFSITFLDRFDLRNYSLVSPNLTEELDALIELDPDLIPETSKTFTNIANISGKSWINKTKLPAPLPDTKGTDLCNKLKGTKRGKTTWSEFEKLCVEILKYLFPNELQGWHEQKRTDDGVSRFDFVCRVRPTTEFWKFLVQHLNSRYVIFEFKNYVGQIKQGQILTTEKYLLERGLRKVAIIFTRAGADKNAIKMTQGAMREHGKLMIVVDDETICKMLHMKEQGEDPTDKLFELVDNFLLSLPR